MIDKQQPEQYHCQTEPVAVLVRVILTHNNFRSHPALLTHNAKIGSEWTDIIIIANQHIAIFRIDKEVAVVDILITVSIIVQSTEGFDNIDCCRTEGVETFETRLFLLSATHKKVGQFFVTRRAHIHQIAKLVVINFGNGFWPEKSIRWRTIANIVFEVLIEVIFLSLENSRMIPFQSIGFAVVRYLVDRTLTTRTKFIQNLNLSTSLNIQLIMYF